MEQGDGCDAEALGQPLTPPGAFPTTAPPAPQDRCPPVLPGECQPVNNSSTFACQPPSSLSKAPREQSLCIQVASGHQMAGPCHNQPEAPPDQEGELQAAACLPAHTPGPRLAEGLP